MTTNRPYLRARDAGDALDELRADAGSQFDPVVVAALLRVVSAAPSRISSPWAGRVLDAA